MTYSNTDPHTAEVKTIIEDITETGTPVDGPTVTLDEDTIVEETATGDLPKDSTAIVFSAPVREEDGTLPDPSNTFSYQVLTPSKYDNASELPFNVIIAHATAVFLSDQENLNMIMEQFQAKIESEQATAAE